jgi:hypothetical protein
MLVVPFQHVTEAFPFEVDLINEPAMAAIVIKNLSSATGVLFLHVVYMIRPEDLRIIVG